MLQRPTFRAAAGNCPAKAVRPFWSCSGWGLHETYVTIDPRELLPHDFTLTARGGGMFLLHFPYSYLRRTLSGILALRSPDFPHTAIAARDCLSYPDPNEFQIARELQSIWICVRLRHYNIDVKASFKSNPFDLRSHVFSKDLLRTIVAGINDRNAGCLCVLGFMKFQITRNE